MLIKVPADELLVTFGTRICSEVLFCRKSVITAAMKLQVPIICWVFFLKWIYIHIIHLKTLAEVVLIMNKIDEVYT
jgi:hypothetical protein